MLLHLALKHKQLRQKMAEENISADVLTPITLRPLDGSSDATTHEVTSGDPSSPVTSADKQEKRSSKCAVCGTSPARPLFEHALSDHGFSRQEYLMIKNRLETEDKKPTLPLHEGDRKPLVQGCEKMTQ